MRYIYTVEQVLYRHNSLVVRVGVEMESKKKKQGRGGGRGHADRGGGQN
jgi:hypothetical protein